MQRHLIMITNSFREILGLSGPRPLCWGTSTAPFWSFNVQPLMIWWLRIKNLKQNFGNVSPHDDMIWLMIRNDWQRAPILSLLITTIFRLFHYFSWPTSYLWPSTWSSFSPASSIIIISLNSSPHHQKHCTQHHHHCNISVFHYFETLLVFSQHNFWLSHCFICATNVNIKQWK